MTVKRYPDKQRRTQPVPQQAKRRGSGEKKSRGQTEQTLLSANADHVWAAHRKRTAWDSFIKTLIAALLMAVTAVALWYVSRSMVEKPELMFMPEGEIEHAIGVEALLIRDETVQEIPQEGSFVPSVIEGSRVAKDESIAMLVPESQIETVNSLQNVRQQIVRLQGELMRKGRGTEAKRIFNESDTQILPMIHMIREDGMGNRGDGLPSYLSSIQIILEQRDSGLENVDFEDAELAALLESRNQLKAQLEDQSVSVRASLPGIVSYNTDGLEAQLRVDSLELFTRNQLEEFLSSSRRLMQSDNSEEGTHTVRICQNNTQFLAAFLPGASMQDLSAGEKRTHRIRIIGEGVILTDCTVVKEEPMEDGIFVIFSTSQMVERFLEHRVVDIQILMTSPLSNVEEGKTRLRIPISALLNDDYEQTGIGEIFLNESGYAKKYSVIVVDFDREYAMIESVKGSIPNTESILIKNPGSIREGEKVVQ